MFDLTVTIHSPVDEQPIYTTAVSLWDEQLTSEDEINDYVAREADVELDYEEYGYSYGTLAENVPRATAFEYVEQGYSDSLDEDVVEAAVYLDIPPSDMQEAYAGSFGTVRDFVEDQIDQFEVTIPNWVCVDHEATWESALRFDYVEHNGVYFRNI